MPYCWWEGWDSNSRNLSVPDLQSGGFNQTCHTFPYWGEWRDLNPQNYMSHNHVPYQFGYIHLVTLTGFEPVLLPWKGSVLTAWPKCHIARKYYFLVFELNILVWWGGWDLNSRNLSVPDLQSGGFNQTCHTSPCGDANGIRTRDSALKGRRLGPLVDSTILVGEVGFEPTKL